ncbi:MAG: hypothetical protein GTO30_17200 [Acidobacteria bacterium]|nr:hypothetical protein [Acidobacteriota bacterium]NIQ83895.1 hypothetical protein [Acidobacteriota bacterium]
MRQPFGLGIAAPRALACALLACVGPLAVPAIATEPDGHVRLVAEWVQPRTPQDSPLVRLTIHPLVALDDVTLTVTAPIEFSLQPVRPQAATRFTAVPPAQDRLAIRADLSLAGPATASTFDFQSAPLTERIGIVEFIVEGRDAAGQRVVNAIGIASGKLESAGTERLGAFEFPAVVLPPQDGGR